jgi:predicted nucleotidyltransferase component of viral defense system
VGLKMDIKEIRKKSLETGLSINYIMKDKEISNIFKKLEGKINNLILKGGTALNRVYFLDGKRFSEDLDFDIFTFKDINTIKEEIYQILKIELKEYILNKPRIMNQTIRYDVQYINEFNQKDKIKLEFKLNKKKMPLADIKIINQGFSLQNPSLYKVYSLNELLDQKINAFLNRDEGKDIYDIYQILLTDKKLKINNKEVFLKLEKLISDDSKIKYYNNSTNHFIIKKNRLDFSVICKEIINLKK